MLSLHTFVLLVSIWWVWCLIAFIHLYSKILLILQHWSCLCCTSHGWCFHKLCVFQKVGITTVLVLLSVLNCVFLEEKTDAAKDVLLFLWSLPSKLICSAAASSMSALKQPTIKVAAIIAEGVPESDAKQLIAYAKANNKVILCHINQFTAFGYIIILSVVGVIFWVMMYNQV